MCENVVSPKLKEKKKKAVTLRNTQVKYRLLKTLQMYIKKKYLYFFPAATRLAGCGWQNCGFESGLEQDLNRLVKKI